MQPSRRICGRFVHAWFGLWPLRISLVQNVNRHLTGPTISFRLSADVLWTIGVVSVPWISLVQNANCYLTSPSSWFSGYVMLGPATPSPWGGGRSGGRSLLSLFQVGRGKAFHLQSGAREEEIKLTLHSHDSDVCHVAQDSICVPFLAECETWVWDTPP